MDFDALAVDLDKGLSKLPPGLLKLLAQMANEYKDEVSKLLPMLMADLQPHLMAGLLESSTVGLDKDGLEKCVMGVFKKYAPGL